MKIFVLVDYQKDFVSGALGFPRAVELDPYIAARVRKAGEEGEKIICTMDTHQEDYLNTQEGRILPIPHCILSSDGWCLYGETAKAIQKNPDPVICVYKNTFGSMDLAKQLQELAQDEEDVTVEFAGVVTNMCVISNAVIAKAALPEAKIIINSKLCASFDETLHKNALAVMAGMQMAVI